MERPIYGEDESLLTISDLLDGRPDFNEETSGSGNETPPVDNEITWLSLKVRRLVGIPAHALM